MYQYTANTTHGTATVTANRRLMALCLVRAQLPGATITHLHNDGPACTGCGALFTPNPAANDQHCTKCVVNAGLDF